MFLLRRDWPTFDTRDEARFRYWFTRRSAFPLTTDLSPFRDALPKERFPPWFAAVETILEPVNGTKRALTLLLFTVERIRRLAYASGFPGMRYARPPSVTLAAFLSRSYCGTDERSAILNLTN